LKRNRGFIRRKFPESVHGDFKVFSRAIKKDDSGTFRALFLKYISREFGCLPSSFQSLSL
jgi:hypothetical protein